MSGGVGTSGPTYSDCEVEAGSLGDRQTDRQAPDEAAVCSSTVHTMVTLHHRSLMFAFLASVVTSIK